jgi:hypothetical protein
LVEVDIVPAVTEHCHMLASVIRKEDAAEIYAESGRDPFGVIFRSLLSSPGYAKTVYFDDEIAGMCGLADFNLLAGIKMGWALTGQVVNRYPKTFFKTSLTILADMRKHDRENSMIFNLVDARYVKALNWLRRIGFDVVEVPFEHGPERRLFHLVVLRGV